MSSKDAAKNLGVCLQKLTKDCRKYGIDRWPRTAMGFAPAATTKAGGSKEGDSAGEEDSFVAAIMCEHCGDGGDAERMVLCDKCDRGESTHITRSRPSSYFFVARRACSSPLPAPGWYIWCLNPKLDDIPAGNWFCEECTPIMDQFPVYLIPLPVRRTRVGSEFQLHHIPDDVEGAGCRSRCDCRRGFRHGRGFHQSAKGRSASRGGG